MIKASPETVRAVAAALGLARLIDDRVGPADSGRIAAWSELVDPHKLSEDDLLDGVRGFYTGSREGRMIQVADLIAAAREVRRERAEREPVQVQTEREKLLAAKVAEDIGELAQRKAILEDKYRRPSGMTPLSVPCPWCKSRARTRCVIPGSSDQVADFHPSRYDAARIAS